MADLQKSTRLLASLTQSFFWLTATYILTKLDDLFVRHFLFVAVFLSLGELANWQLSITLVIQAWYTVFLAWQVKK
jgi:hypothetical protein